MKVSLGYVEIRNLTRKYSGGFTLLNINISMNKGEIFTLMGPSGSGKTSLLRNICGLDIPDTGSVMVNGSDITHIPVERRNIGLIFQDLALFPHLTAYENIAYGLKARRTPETRVRESIREIASLLNIEHVLDRIPDRISGGERQRVALARSLVLSPDLLLMDEPLSSLDPELRADIRTQIKRISKMLGLTIIYVTHEREEALYLGDKMGIIFNGSVIRIEEPRTLFEDPVSERVARFLGYNIIRQGREKIGVLPSQVRISPDKGTLSGKIIASGFEGDHYRIDIDIGDGQIVQVFQPNSQVPLSEKSGETVYMNFERSVKIGSP
ncbi:MAG: ABC transporter ATP-binding protein [Candidatus Thermoplasmatota archaeon]|nr:ABC transporter ATP-binding protein [Candidatus Thermoplasmatota archaeon]